MKVYSFCHYFMVLCTYYGLNFTHEKKKFIPCNEVRVSQYSFLCTMFYFVYSPVLIFRNNGHPKECRKTVRVWSQTKTCPIRSFLLNDLRPRNLIAQVQRERFNSLFSVIVSTASITSLWYFHAWNASYYLELVYIYISTS